MWHEVSVLSAPRARQHLAVVMTTRDDARAAPAEATSPARPRDSVPSRRVRPQNPPVKPPPRAEPRATLHPPVLLFLLVFSSVFCAAGSPLAPRAWDAGGTRCLPHTYPPSPNLKLSKGSAQLSPQFVARFPGRLQTPAAEGAGLGAGHRLPRGAPSLQGRRRGSGGAAGKETPNPLPFPLLGSRDSSPVVEAFCSCGVAEEAGCLKSRSERHPGTPREGDAVSYPAEFPFLSRLLFEKHSREQPVHPARWKEIDLKVARCTKLP